jgi:hypothetical protein
MQKLFYCKEGIQYVGVEAGKHCGEGSTEYKMLLGRGGKAQNYIAFSLKKTGT